MKKLLFITTFISLAWGQSHCHVFGKIKFVEYGEDYKVKFVEYGEDLNIKYVSYGESQVGNWKTVEYGEKYKIKVVDYGEDFSVKLVDYGEGCNTSGSSSSSSITAKQVQALYPDFSDNRTEEQKRKDAEDLEKKRKEYDDYWSNASCGELIVGGALMYWIISMLVEMWGDDQEPVSVYDFDEDDGIY